MHQVEFCGIAFKGLRKQDLLSDQGGLKQIVTVNAEAIVLANEYPKYMEVINKNIACFDGQVPLWIARRKFAVYIEKLSGSDLIFDFAEMAARARSRVFLLGGDEDSNADACRKLAARFGTEIKGFAPPHESYPFGAKTDELIIKELTSFRPRVLLVAFGMPKQEFWISDHRDDLEALGIKWAIGVGGAFDFVSGREERAPRFLQHLGLEGVWRLTQRPGRWRRFLRVLRLFRYIT